MMHLVYDTETTGLWNDNYAVEHAAQPHLVQLAMRLYDESGDELFTFSALNEDIEFIPIESQNVHHKTVPLCKVFGMPLDRIVKLYAWAMKTAGFAVCYNTAYDWPVMKRAAWHVGIVLHPTRHYCVMKHMSHICKIPKRNPKHVTDEDPYQWPKLHDAYFKCFETMPAKQHDALDDVHSTEQMFQWLLTHSRETVLSRTEELR